MDSNRPKPQKPNPGPANKKRPPAPQTPAAKGTPARAPAKPAQSRLGFYFGIASCVVLLVAAVYGGYALPGLLFGDAKKTEVAANKWKDAKSGDKARGLPGKTPGGSGAFVAHQEDGPEVNPPVDEANPGFRVEDEGEKAAPTPLKIDVVMTDPPKAKVEPKPEPKKTGADVKPWVTFEHGPNSFGVSTTAHAAKLADKKLTPSATGETSSTVFRINGTPHVPDAKIKAKLDVQRSADNIPIGSEKVWTVGAIEIAERIDVVSGNPAETTAGFPRPLDTVQVRYKLTNKGKTAQKAGMRALVDTFVGSSDGVPFVASAKSGVISTLAEFRSPNIPFFLQAFEKPDLTDPGVIAQVTCKPVGVEPPDRVLVTKRVDGNAWDIPLAPFGDDAAVVLYWSEKAIPAGETREVGYDYGLGAVASKDGSLGVGLAAGTFQPKEQFTVTAYVPKPAAKQTATLELSKGLELVGGAATQPVPPVGKSDKDMATVTWRVGIQDAGDLRVKVVTSNGLEQVKPLKIGVPPAAPPPPPDVTAGMSMDVVGPFELGKTFLVRTSMVPKAGDGTFLFVPPLMQVTGLTVPPKFVLGSAVIADFKVQANGPFEALPIKVTLTSGASLERLIAVKVLKREVPLTELEIAAGTKDNTYTVTANVEAAKPGQKLTLELPPGLRRIEGDETIAVPPPEPKGAENLPEKPSVVRWTIEAEKNGSYPIAVESSIGPGTKKKLIVDQKPKMPTGPFTLRFDGDIQPGKTCTLIADVPDPAPGQKLTLELPKGVSLIEGEATQDVPAVALKFENVTSKVRWQVRPPAIGTFSARVVSSTGIARTRVLVIDEKR